MKNEPCDCKQIDKKKITLQEVTNLAEKFLSISKETRVRQVSYKWGKSFVFKPMQNTLSIICNRCGRRAILYYSPYTSHIMDSVNAIGNLMEDWNGTFDEGSGHED